MATGSDSLDRRRFLALAGLAGAGVALGRGRAATTATSHTGTAAGMERLAGDSGVDFAGLRKALAGTLLLPGDSGYPLAAQPYNAALGVRRPAAIARIAHTADVVTCVRRAGGQGLPLAARSGGHSYAGWSTPDHGMVVDLSALRTVQVAGNGMAAVGAGALLIDVYAALAAAGRALPAGSCPAVGVAGNTLGGGIGVLCRAYGLTCDHLRAAEVVTADGDVHLVDGNRNADLYWVLRGGGGGNAGIVTQFTFDTVPAPTVSVFSLTFPAVRTATVLAAWLDWMGAAPDHLWSLCGITAAATPTNQVTGTWTGRPAALAGWLAALVDAVGVAPTGWFTQIRGYLDAMRYFAGCSRLSIAACHPASRPGGTLGRNAFRAASRMLEHRLDAGSARRVVALLARRSPMVLLFDSLGGQITQIGSSDTAFPHRRALASVQVYSGSAGGGGAVHAVQQGLASLVGRGAYVNYLNADQSDWAQAYYAANLPRLHTVVRRYDPHGVFTFPQSVLHA